MPKETHTPLRNVRVSEDVWEAARVGTAAAQTSISAEVNAFLRERYVAGTANEARKAARDVLAAWAHYAEHGDDEALRAALGALADAHRLDVETGKPAARTA